MSGVARFATGNAIEKLNVVCLDSRNYEKRGVEYVRNLHRACQKHITLPFEFVCFSDRVGYGDDIRTIPLSGQAAGWWAKLEILGSKALQGQCLLLDLDTLILANVDDIAAYKGPFAGLGGPRDYRSFGSGILAWEAGRCDHIWSDWLKAGKPILGSGDDEWIDKLMPQALRINRMYPGIYSYKYHKQRERPASDARVIFFQRRPKPHDCGGWAQHYWSTLEATYEPHAVSAD